MTDQPTPETDAMFTENVPDDCQIVAFCERLERERNAARAERDKWHAFAEERDQCPNCEERDQLRTALVTARAELAALAEAGTGYSQQTVDALSAERDDALLRLNIATAKWDAARAEFAAMENAARVELADERAKKSDALIAAVDDIERLRAALELIAAPMRPDGWYERDRTACGSIARAALATSAK